MNKLFRYALLVVLLLGVSQPLLAQSPGRVKKVQIEQVGPQTVSEPLVRANIRVKEGDNVSQSALQNDVQNLMATGYFYDIKIVQDSAPDGVTLTYVLVNKMRVTDIKFVGNKKFSTDKLKKIIKSKVGEPLNEQKLFADSLEIKKKYQNSGLTKTEVKYVPNTDPNAGRATVTFEITETPKIRIVDVIFDGAQAFPQKKLRKELKTRRWWMWSWITQSGKIKDEVFEDDKDRLADFYRNAGYIDFELKEVKQELVTPTRMKLHFVVSEGRQYKVGAIGFKGIALFPTNNVAAVLKMKVGDTFTPKGLATDKEAIEDFYGSRGYIGNRAMGAVFVFPRKNPNVETGTMDLVYEIEEGEESKIEKIEIKGNVRTKDKVIRRELLVSPGERFDMVRVKKSKRRLEQMGFFERVDAHPEETEIPNRKNLAVGVDERNTGNFTIGAGFSSVDSLVGFIDLTQGNFDLFKPPTFTGGGQKFRLHAAVGTERQDYLVSFVEPWFLDQKLALGVDLYFREAGYYSDLFDERRGGGRLSLTKALGNEFLIGGVSYTAESVGIIHVNPNSPTTIVNTEGDFLLSRFGASIAYDTSNNALLPDRGQRTELLTEAVVGDANFYKLEAKTSWYFPGFWEGHVLEVGVKAGVVDSFSDFAGTVPPRRTYTTVDPITGQPTVKSVKNLPANDVPFFERYFLGGAYSLRGFRYRDVSPQERGIRGVGSEPVGGNTYYLAGVEYSIPIIERLRFALFYDMGNVYYESFEFKPSEYYSDYGVGIRLDIPRIGPLRFDYGIPLEDPAGRGGSGRFNFTVGYKREF